MNVETLTAGLSAERDAVVDAGRATSGSELLDRAGALAAGLLANGLCAGDRVLVLIPPGPELLAHIMAIFWNGCVPVFAEPGQSAQAFHVRISRAEPKWMVCDPRLRVVWGLTGGRGLRGVPPRPKGPKLLLAARTKQPAPPMYEGSADEDALILFTSGTTSSPRAIVHSVASVSGFLGRLGSLLRGMEVRHYLVETPAQLLYAMLMGATAHVVRGRGPRRRARVQQYLANSKVDSWFGSPWTLDDLLRRGERLPAQLRNVVLGSAPVTRPFLQRARAGTDANITCMYGLSEAGPVCVVDGDEKLAREGEGDWVGRPLPGVELSLREGELIVHSDGVAHRYIGSSPLEGVVPTGDNARLDDGAWLLGRCKDMIIRRGVNIYPGVLEPIAGYHAREVALVGVWDADREDERVAAFFVDGDARKVARAFGEDSEPDHIWELPELPRSGRQNKVDKIRLREMARERIAALGGAKGG